MLLLAQLGKDEMLFDALDILMQGYLAASSFPNSLSICFFSLFIFFAMRFFRVNCNDICILPLTILHHDNFIQTQQPVKKKLKETVC